jgi:hypothetical protein
MNILLVGEYSSVHTELAIALKQKGHIVFTVSDGDGYKGFPVDLKCLHKQLTINKFVVFLNIISTYLGINGISTFISFWLKNRNKFQNFDVVQLINPIALSGFGSIVNLFFIWYLKNHNKNIFLCAVGDDYYWVKYNLINNTKYTGLKGNLFYRITNSYSSKYVYGLLYKKLNVYALKVSKNVIPAAYDYKIVYEFTNKKSPLTPFPINITKIRSSFTDYENNSKIVLFNGWQKGKERRKGNDVFHEVARLLVNDYPNIFEYLIVQNKTYDEYVRLINAADVFFDQCYSYDKGVNALMGMALGKIVLSGFEKKSLESYPYYDETKEIGINAIASVDYLYDQILDLSRNRRRMTEISKNAIEFIEKNHSSEKVANMYLKIWENNI